MMRPLSLEIEGFRGWKRSVAFSLEAPILALLGENGRGKSSTANAFEWCLFGNAIAKKGSGIDERDEWEIRPRGAASTPTRVTLVVDVRGKPVTIERQLQSVGKAREMELLSVQFDDGQTLVDEAAVRWLREAGFPEWETYRRAHCFHQEAARKRVTDVKDRTAILAALLGLDDDVALREALEQQSAKSLLKEVQAIVSDLEGDYQRAVRSPLEKLHDLEADCEKQGVSRNELSEDKAWEVRRRMLERAAALSSQLELNIEWPAPADTTAILRWARHWSVSARGRSAALDGLSDLHKEVSELQRLSGEYEKLTNPWNQAQLAVGAAVERGNDLESRAAASLLAKKECEAAAEQLCRTNARVALLIDAREFLDAGASTDTCPVCDSRVLDLTDRIDRAIAEARYEELDQLEDAVSAAQSRVVSTEQAENELKALLLAEKQSRQSCEAAREALRRHLERMEIVDVHDVVAEAKKRAERLKDEIVRLKSLEQTRDSSLEKHTQDLQLLEGLEAWCRWNAKAQHEVDVTRLPAWGELNDAVDEAARFASDLDSLANLAREAQESRSQERETAVNSRLEGYYRQIMGDAAATGVRLTTKRTAKKLSYDLIDGDGTDGERVVPILNQAAVNALSLALLFAQAEEQASQGGLALVVLDDPVQSLDAERQAGLVRAIEEVSRSCTVVLASVPGPIGERIEHFVSVPRCIVTFEPWTAEQGNAIADRRTI